MGLSTVGTLLVPIFGMVIASKTKLDEIPLIYFIPAYPIIVLFLLYAQQLFKDLRDSYVARKNGAQLVPVLDSRTPMNIGFMLERIRSQGKIEPGQAYRKHFEMNGTKIINVRICFSDYYVTKDPYAIKHALTGNTFYNYGKGPSHRWALNDLLGDGIFNSDPDETWKFHRSLTKPFFNKERITDFKLDHIDKAIKAMKLISNDDNPVDVQDIFKRLTYSSSCDFLFGYQTNSLDELLGIDGPVDKFANAFDSANFMTLKKVFIGQKFYPVYKFLFGDLLENDLSVINPLVEKIIDDAVLRQSNQEQDSSIDKQKPENHACVLDYLLTQTTNRKLLRDELLNLLLAGRDTTAALLSALIAKLAENPAIYQEAREEAIRLFGFDDPDYRIMRDSKFLRALINETLRMFPPVPLNTRFAFNEDVVTTSDSKRWYIPKQTAYVYSLYDMQRDPEYWGEDSDKWDPYRWLDSRIEKMTSNPFIFQPFSAGARLCLGQQHGYNQATLTLIRILQSFKTIELAKDVQKELRPSAYVTLTFVGGVYVRMGMDQDDSY